MASSIQAKSTWYKYDETYTSNDTQCQDPNMVSKIGYGMAIPLHFLPN